MSRPRLASAGDDNSLLSLSQKMGSCGIRHQPKPPRREQDKHLVTQHTRALSPASPTQDQEPHMHLTSRGMKTPRTKSHLGGNEEKSTTSPARSSQSSRRSNRIFMLSSRVNCSDILTDQCSNFSSGWKWKGRSCPGQPLCFLEVGGLGVGGNSQSVPLIAKAWIYG